MELLVYLATLALFGFVVMGAALIRHEMMLLGSIPPVFLALIMGFVMGIYAGDTFGWAPVFLAVAAGGAGAWWCGRRFSNRDLLISVYLAWSLAMVLALVAFDYPDHA